MLILLAAGGEFRREFRREFREVVQNADDLLLDRQRREGDHCVCKILKMPFIVVTAAIAVRSCMKQITRRNCSLISTQNFKPICTLNKCKIYIFNMFTMVAKTYIVIFWNVLIV